MHKSQLATYRVDNVEDAVSLNDVVFVKVVDVAQERDEESGKMRHRVSLSMKFCSQDDGTDLDPGGDKAAEEMARRGGGSAAGGDFGGGRQHSSLSGQNGVAAALERNLGSNIGMASAIDPMAAMRSQRGAKVVLRGGGTATGGGAGTSSSSGGPTFNGYALVDDDEGEPDVALPPAASELAAASYVAGPARAVGRGRGTALPAWMTRDEGPTGAATTSSGRSRSRSGSDDSSSRDRRKRKKKDSSRRKKSRSKHRSRDRDRDRDRSSRRKERRRDRHDDSRKHRRRRRRSRSRSYDSLSEDDRSKGADDGQFASVEEAKALIVRLEKEKAKRSQKQ